jgi:excisionase family DNA binding protein
VFDRVAIDVITILRSIAVNKEIGACMPNKTEVAIKDAPVVRRAETMREFAASLGVSYDTAWRAATDGRLKTIRFGKRRLIPAAEVERVLSEGL